MNTVKKFLAAFREDKDDIRKNTLIAVGGTLVAIAAGILLTKLNDDRVEVLVIQETEEILLDPTISVDPTEF